MTASASAGKRKREDNDDGEQELDRVLKENEALAARVRELEGKAASLERQLEQEQAGNHILQVLGRSFFCMLRVELTREILFYRVV